MRVGDRDRLDLPTGTVYGLAGNVSEWVVDEGFGCMGKGVQTNPVCRDASSNQLQVRGGAWGEIAMSLKGAARSAIARNAVNANNLGFRCVRH